VTVFTEARKHESDRSRTSRSEAAIRRRERLRHQLVRAKRRVRGVFADNAAGPIKSKRLAVTGGFQNPVMGLVAICRRAMIWCASWP
jgi:hypothetical protein